MALAIAIPERVLEMTKAYDIAVIGGGNAALCAAMTAAEAGAKVLILEAAHQTLSWWQFAPHSQFSLYAFGAAGTFDRGLQ